MTLDQVKINNSVLISQITLNDMKIKRRLCDLGIYSGQTVNVLNKSVLKKTILISVKNYTLSVQKNIAKFIEVNNE